jgi:hypothetical protein
MAPLHPATTAAARADVDVELPVYGLGRNLDLKLLIDVRFVERSAAVGAEVG